MEKKELSVEVVQFISEKLIDFALAYHKSSNKDVANDAAEYTYDEINGTENPLTAYATKLHQCDTANKELEEKNRGLEEKIKELERQNEKMKEQAEGWRPLLEDILRDNNNGYIDIDEALCSRIKKFLYGE